jgi:hypothetical protein
MDRLPRIKVTGALEGDYVVLAERAGEVLKIAAAQPDGAPVVVALEKTCTACPAQWEGKLEDGRALYARYRGGLLRVGIGKDIEDAHTNSFPKAALYCEHVGDGLDGFMDFEELRARLYGLLDFSEDLEVENEHEPNWDLEAFEKIFASKESTDPGPAKEDDEGEENNERDERLGAGLREAEIQDWTCFSCGDALTQAHEGDYFHTDPDSKCFDSIPVPTSLIKVSSAEMIGTEAKSRGAQQAHGRRD